MKKILFLSLIAALFLQTLSAQTTTGPVRPYKIGLQITPSLDWMKPKSNNIDNAGLGIGFDFGATFEYDFAPNYAFLTGINIAHTTGDLTYKDSIRFNSEKNTMYATGTEVKYRIEYIEIPLLIKLKTNEIGYVTYFLQFGIQPAINISAKGDIIGNSTRGINSTKDNEDMGPNTALGNISMVIGGGAAYSLTTSTSAYASINFVNGFINQVDNPTGYTTKAVMNRVALTLGVMF